MHTDGTVEMDPVSAVCVRIAAYGYTGAVERGRPIEGLEHLAGWAQGVVFHAGTRMDDGRLVTDGGRVLGVTALGDTVGAAVAEAYAAVDQVRRSEERRVGKEGRSRRPPAQ